MKHGADIQPRTTWGWYTPLHLACTSAHADAEKILGKLLEENAKDKASDALRSLGQPLLAVLLERGTRAVARGSLQVFGRSGPGACGQRICAGYRLLGEREFI